uniref:Uncharacterized protein n=1 Tax=Wuchereria bancrofti TaxID=6293 RepID=A0AAF5PUQ7_WUCBA
MICETHDLPEIVSQQKFATKPLQILALNSTNCWKNYCIPKK